MIILRFLIPIAIIFILFGVYLLIKPRILAICKKQELKSIQDLKDVAKAADEVTSEEGGSLTDEVALAAATVGNAIEAAERASEALKS